MILPIPAIDIIDGKCVRLTKGDYATEKVYNEEPVEVAKYFADLGFPRLHLVDLDGAKTHHIVNHRTLERIATQTNLIVDFGGGIKSEEDLTKAFDFGAEMVTIGSLAAKEPTKIEEWGRKYGTQRFIIGADAQDERICTNGWLEQSDLMLTDFIAHYMQKDFKQILCTDISHDGTLAGPSTTLYRKVMTAFPDCELIASGGISCLDDFVALEEAGVPAVVFGKAIYEGRIDMQVLSKKYFQ